MFLIIIFALLKFVISNNELEESLIVTTNVGQVKGSLFVDKESNGMVTIFQGIPYAKPPVGELRFKKSEPIEKWSGVLNATHARSACMQTGVSSASEDCLFINIYTPTNSLISGSKKSVMFFIHGGTYLSGTIFSGQFNATHLTLIGDVVVVEVNYRLSIFGFLYDATDDSPGNQALSDYLLALKWVQENIDKFGGDPNSVTIFGESAGAMAVGSLILVKSEPQVLFHRAILESGSPNSYIGAESSDQAFAKAKKLAVKFDCINNVTDKIDILCLRKIDAELLNNYSRKSSLDLEWFTPIYGDKLIPIRPSLALKNGDFRQDIQILFGSCDDEGSGFVADYVSDLKPNTPPSSMTLSKAKLIIQLLFTGLKVPFAKNVSDFYTTNLTDSDGTELKKAVSNAFGDFQLTCPLVLFGSEFATKNATNKAYAYRLTYSWRNSSNDWTGVRHGDDIQYVFGTPLRNPLQYTEQEISLSKTVVDIWSTFAKTGKPPSIQNISWPEAIDRNIDNPSVRYMTLNPENYEIVENAYKHNCEEFWKQYLTDGTFVRTAVLKYFIY